MRESELNLLAQKCDGANSVLLLGNTNCGIRPIDPKVDCSYRADIPDQNGLYVCLHPDKNLLDYGVEQ